MQNGEVEGAEGRPKTIVKMLTRKAVDRMSIKIRQILASETCNSL
jgi:hypothetical protein